MSDLEIIKAIGEIARRAREPGAYNDVTFWELKHETMRAMRDSYLHLGDHVRAQACETFSLDAYTHILRCQRAMEPS